MGLEIQEDRVFMETLSSSLSKFGSKCTVEMCGIYFCKLGGVFFVFREELTTRNICPENDFKL